VIQLGYALSSEEHPPINLVRYAQRAEEVGFGFAMISDHFHPWIDRQGQSPFVWTVIGAVANATERLRLGTGVTCPMIRMHPAIVAQAAATAAAMMPGRFFLGLGTGENLNEHILGDRWPPGDVRLEMLEEAIEVITTLWRGESTTHHGRHYTVEGARIYTFPDEPPLILVAAKGKKTVQLAARSGGLIGTTPDPELLRTFDDAGGIEKPRYGMIHVCWAEDDATARKLAHEWWPNSAVPGELSVELPLPRHFEQAAETITEEDVARSFTCSADPAKHLEAINSYVQAGYDHVYVHQVGPDQEGFFRFYEREILPRLG
jgi:coenzyme F420-dependent glucose-6-phosphate dehydrogenase